jgi:parvulin-like peptidyl-prolyl isomerase
MKRICLLLLILSSLLNASCREEQLTTSALKSRTLLVVGSRQVSVEQFKQDFEASYPQASSLPQDEHLLLVKQLVKQLIEQELILGETARMAITLTPDELDNAMNEVRGQLTQEEFSQLVTSSGKTIANWTKSLKLQLLTTKVITTISADQIQVDDEEAKSYYLSHKAEFNRPEEIRARQMLFKTLEDAQMIQKRLNAGEKFATLAREFSLSLDSEDGGSLGYFARGQLPEEFERHLFDLPLHQVSNPVKSSYGYHLFLVERRREAGQRSYTAVKDEIVAKLREEKEEQVFHQWLERLLETTEIMVNWDLLSNP